MAAMYLADNIGKMAQYSLFSLYNTGQVFLFVFFFFFNKNLENILQPLFKVGYQYVLNRSRHVQLFMTPWTIACQAPMSMGILQARMLEWVAMPSSKVSIRVTTLEMLCN